MTEVYVVIVDGVVINGIAWTGAPPIDWPEGWLVLNIPEGEPQWIGWLYDYDTGVFSPPPEPAE